MNFAANLTMLFTEYDFLDRFEKAYKYNFKAVEDERGVWDRKLSKRELENAEHKR